MYRQTILTLILALLLVATGFILGQFYTIVNGVPVINALSFLSDEEDNLDNNEETGEITRLSAGDSNQVNDIYDDAVAIPEEIGSLKLLRVVDGEKALDEGARFLGNIEAIEKVTIPHFVGGNNQATVWIVETQTNEDAGKILGRMNTRLEDSDVFDNHHIIALENLIVYSVEGLNMVNYYYQRDSNVLWLSITSDDAQKILKELVQYF